MPAASCRKGKLAESASGSRAQSLAQKVINETFLYSESINGGQMVLSLYVPSPFGGPQPDPRPSAPPMRMPPPRRTAAALVGVGRRDTALVAATLPQHGRPFTHSSSHSPPPRSHLTIASSRQAARTKAMNSHGPRRKGASTATRHTTRTGRGTWQRWRTRRARRARGAARAAAAADPDVEGAAAALSGHASSGRTSAHVDNLHRRSTHEAGTLDTAAAAAAAAA